MIARQCMEASFILAGEDEAEKMRGWNFKVTGKDFGPVRRLSGGPLEYQKGTPSMESGGETAKEGGGGDKIVHNVILGGGLGSITFWGGDLGFVRDDAPEAGKGACGILNSYNGTEGSTAEGRDLEICGRRVGP